MQIVMQEVMAMLLHDVYNDGNRYCGPAAISAIAGIGTHEAARLLREHTGKSSIKGTYANDVLAVLEKLGFKWKERKWDEGKTIGQWCDRFPRDPNKLYLISASHHWQVIGGDKYVCSKTIVMVGLKCSFVPRRSKIKTIFEISK